MEYCSQCSLYNPLKFSDLQIYCSNKVQEKLISMFFSLLCTWIVKKSSIEAGEKIRINFHLHMNISHLKMSSNKQRKNGNQATKDEIWLGKKRFQTLTHVLKDAQAWAAPGLLHHQSLSMWATSELEKTMSLTLVFDVFLYALNVRIAYRPTRFCQYPTLGSATLTCIAR
jgi:hypothetical protein